MKTPFSFLTLILFLIPNLNFGQAPSLGGANSFAVFTAVGAFSNLGATVVTGDIGTDVGLFSGFPPGVVMGSIHVADPVADQAAIDVAAAYVLLDGMTCNTVLGVTLGGGQMLTPDIYCIGAAATLNGTLVLDGQGDPNSLFIFQIDGALATGTLASVVLINGASLCNVYWQVNGAFTLGDGSVFRGNVLANGAIHLLEASSLFGRALSQGGAVDLHNNIIGIGLPPIAAIITANGPTTFCVGDSVTLSGNIDGVWSNGSLNADLVVTTAGDYFVVNTTLCSSDTSNHILVSLNPDNPPTITCPIDITVSCTSLVPAPNAGSVTSSDDCGGIATVTFGGDVISAQTCANRFTVTRTYIATDATGNATVCTQTITVIDNTAPAITCPVNITVQCLSLVPVPDPSTLVSLDNCGGLSTVVFVNDVISGQTCANRFNINRSYLAVDDCGNTTLCTQVITVFDDTPPSITCPGNVTVLCANQVPVADAAGIVTADNCGGAATVTFTGDVISNFVCTNQFVVNRTYQAVDDCGNTAVCTQQIIVFDNSALSILCPGNVTVSCASEVPPVDLNLGVIANGCGGTSTVSLQSAVISNQTCANRFTLTRTYLATDVCAQSASCVQTITVLDNTPPVIILPNGLANGSTLDVQCYGQDPNWDLPVYGVSDVTTTDNCIGAVTVTFAQVIENQGTCATDGYIDLFRLSWTATDACGNSSTAFLFMALIDTIPPVIHGIPADITVNCDAIPLPPTIVFATDECLCACVLFVSETQPVAGCADGQVILRTWTAKDRCGNQTTEIQRITLVNNKPPTLQLLQPEMTGLIDGSMLEYTCSEGGIPSYINGLSAVSIVSTSTCGDAVNVTFDRKVINANNCDFSGYIQQQILHWEAVDLCGNVASMTITVSLIDNEAPVLIGVPSLTCLDDPSLLNIEATDNCSEAHVRFWDNTIPNPCGAGTAIRRTYEAYDDCGNIARDTAVLIPNDLASPNLEFVNPMLDSLGVGDIIVLNCAAHDQQMTLFGTQDVVSNDPCTGPVKLTFEETLLTSGDCSPGSNVALMQLLWTATDVCGNLSTLTAIASIEDKTSPVFVNFRAVVGIGCNDVLPVYVASDNCGSVTITTSDRYFYSDCPTKYYIEREITATDPCGNATVAFQTINVGGSGPVITGLTEEICDDLSLPDVTAFDECAGVPVDVTMVQDTLEEACRGLVIQRTWTAVDACGDTTTVIQHIYVGDTIAPVILIPSYSLLRQFVGIDYNVVYLSEVEWMKKIAAFDENTISVSDDCGLVIIPVFTYVVTHDDCLLTGFSEHRVYTWVATDACGNSASLTITINIIDDMPPVITGVPNDTTIVCAPLPVAPVVQADDTALPTTIVYTETISPDDGTGVFIVTRTWTATDACGNISVVVQHIKWIPNSLLTCNINVPEQVVCNSHDVIITSDVTGGTGPFTYVWQIVGNKCFIQGGQGTPVITIYMGWEDVKIILTVTDANGCVSMCMYILHCLEPGELPFASNPGFIDPDANSNTISGSPFSALNQEQGIYLKDLRLWPNPAKGTINLSFASSVRQEVVFSFVNFLGQVMMSETMDVNKGMNSRSIDIDQIAGGSYLMEVKSAKDMLTKVVVIMP